MPKVSFIPGNQTTQIWEGSSLKDAANAAGVVIQTPCGGSGLCRKCPVKVVSGDVRGDVDRNGFYLACRTIPLADCVVEVPEVSAAGELHILGFDRSKHFDLNPPAFLNSLPDHMSKKDALGIAVDLGTTSVVAALLKLIDGEVLSVSSTANPQAEFGEDVISRITYAGTADGLSNLQSKIVSCLGDLFENLLGSTGNEGKKVVDIVVSGNALMNHLLLGVSPVSLGVAPYEPSFRTHDPVSPGKIGFMGIENASMRVLPNIAGFVGGDAVAGILATGLHLADKLKLFIDIGTNGEIVLGNRNRLLASSAAAGPAFEGGRISNGMRAEIGAIDHVRINDDVKVSTIGNAPARGICGSGLIELVGELLSNRLIDVRGRFIPTGGKGNLPDRFEGSNGERRFILHDGEERQIVVYQKDIYELQLAKAAIRAGIDILLDNWGTTFDDVDEIYLAGAFGNYLRVKDLVSIGILPDVDEDIVKFAGNTSIEGAVMALLSVDACKSIDEVASTVEYIELAEKAEFQEKFVKSLEFPEDPC